MTERCDYINDGKRCVLFSRHQCDHEFGPIRVVLPKPQVKGFDRMFKTLEREVGSVSVSAGEASPPARRSESAEISSSLIPSVESAKARYIRNEGSLDDLILVVQQQSAQEIERHDCESWAMEGIGCARCNPAASERQELIKRAEAAEASLAELQGQLEEKKDFSASARESTTSSASAETAPHPIRGDE